MAQSTLTGTTLKMLVGFSYPADPTVTLDSISWSTEWYTARPDKKIELTKAQHTCETVTVEGVTTVSYYAILDTTLMGPGVLRMRLKAAIGTRTEYAETKTNVMVL